MVHHRCQRALRFSGWRRRYSLPRQRSVTCDEPWTDTSGGTSQTRWGWSADSGSRTSISLCQGRVIVLRVRDHFGDPPPGFSSPVPGEFLLANEPRTSSWPAVGSVTTTWRDRLSGLPPGGTTSARGRRSAFWIGIRRAGGANFYPGSVTDAEAQAITVGSAKRLSLPSNVFSRAREGQR